MINQSSMRTKARVVNVRDSRYDVYIGRGSIWGNPFRIGRDGDRSTVISKYREYARKNKRILDSLHLLEGKVLGCYCKPKACHGDVLIEMLAERNNGNRERR